MVTYHVISLFPESLDSYVNSSILKRAQERGIISIKYYNPRDFAMSAKFDPKAVVKMSYAERRVDDRPYGGGPGMVMEALPVIRAIAKAVGKAQGEKRKAQAKRTKIIFFSPSGKQFTNTVADSFKKYTDIVLVCGRYEGIDARVKKAFPMTDLSIGEYVLTGGELPAMVVIDTITRRIPGVLGNDNSVEERRVAGSDVYTRPPIIEYKGKKLRVPKILLTGHHEKIDEWKIKGKSAR
ncbi:MAG: tRNA (guanosine(37)-N1)-methyltransferase TrmD [Candidatus Taylorbacteria bacterium]